MSAIWSVFKTLSRYQRYQKTRKIIFLFFTTFFLNSIFSSISYAAPKTFNFQARIKKPDGKALESSSVNFRFTYLDEVGSCVLYSEDFAGVALPVGGGGFVNIPLGTGTRVYPSAGVTILADVFNNSGLSLTCQSGAIFTPVSTDRRSVVMQFSYSGSSGWQTLAPIKINSVPYAMYSGESLNAENATKLGGVAASSYTKKTDFTTCVGTEVLTFNGTNFSCTTPGGAGTVTAVTAGAPLMSSGGATPNITLAKATAGADGYLSSADWSAFNSKLSAANNLSDLANITTARTNLGLGTAAVLNAPASGDASAAELVKGDDSRLNNALQTSSSLSGDVTGTISATVVSSVGGKTAANIATSVNDTQAATSSNTGSTIVRRNASGDFTAGVISATTFSGTNVSANNTSTQNVYLYDALNINRIIFKAPAAGITNYTLTLPAAVGTNGQVLSTNASGDLSWVNATAGSVTNVTANAPLSSSGGATPAISITKANGTTDGYLASTDWTVFNDKLGTASTFSGDVSGTSSTISVDKLKGTALNITAITANNYLRYNGTNWVNANLVSTDITSSLGYTPLNPANSLSGDVTGTVNATVVSSVGGKSSSDISTSVNDTQAATSSNTVSTIVKRDVSGNFAAGVITATTFSGTNVNTTNVSADNTLTKNIYLYDSGSNNILFKAPATVTSNYTLTLPAAVGTNGQVLSTNASGDLSWVNATAGSVTNVTANAPLSSSGGATPAISITKANGTTDGYLASTDWTVFNDKLGTASTFSGDVSGTSSTTSVDKIKGTAVSGSATTAGQFLVYNGTTQYVPTVMSGDATMSSAGVLTLANTIGSSGTSSKVTYDEKGRITAVAAQTSADITTALAYTPVNKAGDTMTGALNLPSNGLTVGTNQLAVSGGKVGVGTASPATLLDVGGDLSITQQTTAPSSTNRNSPILTFGGRFYDGTFGQADQWTMQSVMGAGANPTSTLTFQHSGSLGVASYAFLNGKISVGIASADGSAALDVTSTTAGVLIPRMTTAQRDAIGSPAAGLQVYNTTTNALNYHNGTGWQALGIAGAGLSSLNGLTDTTQTFAVGSAGSDINISSATSTHTFNFPTASAVNRGVLSSSDWTVFNDKLGTSSTFSGDVSGTSSTTSVDKIKGTALNITAITANNYLRYNGTNWVNSNLVSTDITSSLGYTPMNPANSLSGDVTGTVNATVVSSVGGKSSSDISTSVNDTQGATSSNTVSTIVKRDVSGNFAAGVITATTFSGTNVNTTNVSADNTLTKNIYLYDSASNYVLFKAPATVTSNYTLTLPAAVGTNGQVLSTNASGDLSWVNATAGSVTNVTANAPLSSSGGATPAISITKANGTTDGYLASTDWTVFNDKLGTSSTFSGDVSGTSSTTSVDKLKGTALNITAITANNYLRYNGTNWVNSNLVSTDITSSLGYTPMNPANSLSGDVTGTVNATVVSSVGGKSSSDISTSVNDTQGATSSNTVSTIVKRDVSGNFAAGVITATTFSGTNVNTTNVSADNTLTKNIYLYDSASNNILFKAPATVTSNYTLTLPAAVGTNGQVLSTNASGDLSWVNATAGSVTNVTANAPLSSSGGATPAISITKANGTTDGYLASTDWTVFNDKLGTASTFSGDVSGTSSTTSVDKLKGTALNITAITANNYLRYNGTNWVNANLVSTDITSSLGYTPLNPANSLSGDVTGTVNATVVSSVGGKSSSDISTSVNDTQAATSSNTVSTIVKRDVSGNFAAGVITATTFSGTNVNTTNVSADNTLTKNIYLYDSGSNNILFKAPATVTSNYTLTLPAAVGTNGQVLSTNASGDLSWVNATAGSVTNVTANAPLSSSGGATPAISITKANGTTDGYLASTDWTVFNDKLGTSSTFSGDVSGTSSTTSVDKIKGTAVSGSATTAGQFLVYNGTTQYVPTVMSGDATMSSAGVLTLANTIGSSGTSSKVTYDEKGRITAVAAQTSADITTALAYTPVNKAGDTMTGALNLPSNGLTVGTNQLAVSGGNVGVGTASPESLTHIANLLGTGTTLTLGNPSVASNNNNDATIKLYGENAGAVSSGTITQSSVNMFIESNGGAGQILFESNILAVAGKTLSAEDSSMTKTITLAHDGTNGVLSVSSGDISLSGGDVGIGTASPTAVLHLKAGTATANTAPLKLTSGTSLTTPEAGAIEYDGTNLFYTDGTATRRTVASTTVLGSYLPLAGGTMTGALNMGGYGINGNTTSGGNLILDSTTHGTKGKIVMATQGGNVGIGTSIPGSTLSVAKATAPTTNTQATEYLHLGSTEQNTNSYRLIGFGYKSSETYSPAYLGFLETSTTGSSVGDLIFGTRSVTTDTQASERLRIAGSGNVGIGTASPTAVLHLKAGTATASTAPLKFTAGTNLTTPEAGAIEYDGTNLFYTDGTATRRTVASTTALGSYLPLAGGTMTGALNMGGTTIYGSTASSGDLTLASSSHATQGNILLATSGGKVGIGTASPETSLHVQSAADAVLNIYGADTSQNGVHMGSSFTNRWAIGQNTAANNRNLYIWRDHSGVGGSTGFVMTMLTSSGYVGVGTTTPGSRLEVANGSITTAFSDVAATTVDFSTANVIRTSAAAGTLTLSNMRDGTSYTLILSGTGTFTLSGSSVTTWRCSPACPSAEIYNDSGHALITILKAGTTAYVSYIVEME